jgi:preprotein translocase subunit YajC
LFFAALSKQFALNFGGYILTGIAYAAAPPPQGAQGPAGGMQTLAQFLPIIFIFGIVYFLLIRPQQKKQKETKAMIESIKKGDKVITSGGIHGVVTGMTDNTVTLKVSDKTNVTFQRSAVAALPGKSKS